MSDSNAQPDIVEAETGYEDSDGDTPMAEKDLAENAQWKVMQKNTFTRWTNEHLKTVGMRIENIDSDFSDGLKLAALVEVLAKHKFKLLNRKPTFVTQKLENVTTVLNFLEEHEKLRFVSIDSSHIVDGNSKLILGLIWTLILHYSISMPMWNGEEDVPKEEVSGGPKQRLLGWINTKLPEAPVRNLTTDWNSGVAIGALVDACAPGLCPDWVEWENRPPLKNATEAMTVAEEWLSVPQLVKPEEMIDPNVDEKSMMTYISQFPNAKLKEGAPLKPKTNASHVRAFGPGLGKKGNVQGVPTEFTVETTNAGEGSLEMIVLNPKGTREPCQVSAQKDNPSIHSCTYTPSSMGKYRVIIKFAGKEIPYSPFQVEIGEEPIDFSSIVVQGPGIQSDLPKSVDRPAYFQVLSNSAGPGLVECTIIDPNGRRDTAKARITNVDAGGSNLVEYVPKLEGTHQIFVSFAGHPLNETPYEVHVGPRESGKAFKPELVYATGRGIQPEGIRVQDQVSFMVHTQHAGDQAPLQVTMSRSDGEVIPVDMTRVDDHLWSCAYRPQRPGKYALNVLYGGSAIQQSPFSIIVGPYKDSSIKVFGPGLHGGVVNRPAIFTVVPNGDTDAITFSIVGSSMAKMENKNNDDGSALVTYWVYQPGEYAFHIKSDGQHIPGSPYMIQFRPDDTELHAEQLKVYGSGIGSDDTQLVVGKPAEIYINGLTDALPKETVRLMNADRLESLVQVDCHDELGNEVMVQSKRMPDGTIVYSYTPMNPGIHTITLVLCDISLLESPFKVKVDSDVQPNKIRVWGPGLEKAAWNHKTYFNIDVRKAFVGPDQLKALETHPLSVNITDEYERPIDSTVTAEQEEGVYRIDYSPQSGTRKLIVTPALGSMQMTQNLINVPVDPGFDISDVKVSDLEQKVFKSSFLKFSVDASSIDREGKGSVATVLVTPDHERLACPVENNKDGTYTCCYTPADEGPYQLEVTYEGLPVPGSPFKVRAVSGFDASRIKAYGPGLEDGPHLAPNVQTGFTIDLVGAGEGGLGLVVHGPGDTPLECENHRDGTCTVYYTPTEPGSHEISVRFNDTEIPGSPFHVNVNDKIDPKAVKCSGPGLETDVRSSVPTYFIVDTKGAGTAPLKVHFSPKPGAALCPATIEPIEVVSKKHSKRTQHRYKVSYTPESEGPCSVEVLFANEHVPGSPFIVEVLKASQPERVHVLGPGIVGPIAASLPTTFTVDARQAGVGDLSLDLKDPSGYDVPIRVAPLSTNIEGEVMDSSGAHVASLAPGDVSESGLLACTFEPYVVGPHTIHVMFSGVDIEDSPFTVMSEPIGRADLCEVKDGLGEEIAVGEEHCISVNTVLAGKGRLTCRAIQKSTDPSSGDVSTVLPVETEDNGDGIISLYYTPTHTGQLELEIRYGGNLVPNGEIVQKVVSAEELEKPIYRTVEFRLSPPKEEGEIESVVLRPTGVKESVAHVVNDDGSLTVTYDPKEEGMHQLHMNLYPTGTLGAGNRDEKDGKPLQPSPYGFFVDRVNPGRVTAFGPGLSHGVTSELSQFTIVTEEAGGGGLSLSIMGPSKTEINCEENVDGTYTASYTPMVPGEYIISIRYMHRHIAGSPFTAKIIGDADPCFRYGKGDTADFSLDVHAADLTELTATVRCASGREEPCVLKRLQNNRLGISFTPKEVGEHVISVFHSGEHIANSPFRIHISEKEIGDPRRVRVAGPGLISGQINEPNEFTVDTRDAGYAGLSLSIEGPSTAEINCRDNHDGTCTVIYTASEPGAYVINVKYADQHVPNSPFYVDIQGPASIDRLTEQITRQLEARSTVDVGSQCQFQFSIADTSEKNITATVTSPSGRTVPCEIGCTEPSHYIIRFIPKELGEHAVTVTHNGLEIDGSPFQFTVGPITDGVARLVRVIGQGLHHGFVNEENHFNVYTHEAGAGKLSIFMDGPGRTELAHSEQFDGSSIVSYRVSLPGLYLCSIKFNDEHIPYSPFRIFISDSSKPGLVSSYSLPPQYVSAPGAEFRSDSPVDDDQIGRPVAFTVHHEEVYDKVVLAQVHAPSGSFERAIVNPIYPNQYDVSFTPHEGGSHVVHVHSVPVEASRKPHIKLGPDSIYEPIDGSPFCLLVNQHKADPGMVHATGDGLRRGKVDVQNSFLVNTVNAGTGVLNVTIDGPSKVVLSTQEQDDGYLFTYVPPMPGIYDIAIKFGGKFHIAGSPFRAEISGTTRSTIRSTEKYERQSYVTVKAVNKTYAPTPAADQIYAKNVRCHGLGLKRANIKSENYFNVDTTDAASQPLLVGICGPTRPSDEVKVKHVGNHQFTVSYRVCESGKHILIVKWGEMHVAGSPFLVHVP